MNDGNVLALANATDTDFVGGKAASLAKLTYAGFDVPNGFVITTKAQRMTVRLRHKVFEAFDKLGAEFVAVRSSAVAEDGSKDAWAGQLDTFLNITKNRLLEKIDLCWKSADSKRARAYAEQKGLEVGKVAILIQVMVPSETSGVAFSIHPVTSNSTLIVIEAVLGLGEKLVSGSVTPDTYIIDKNSSKIIERHIPDKQILGTDQLRKVVSTVKKIENIYGFPVDIEWSFAKGKFFVLQCRPITALG